MADRPSEYDPTYLRAIVDMGSNGIRFSISSLQPPTARIMPTLYQHRAGISLYDAQYSASGERQPIDEHTIATVIAAFKQFKRTCSDFHVLDQNIVVLATEATRTASNSQYFREQIKSAVGWDVTMLAKEEEGRIGAMGIASSLPSVSGLVMDLGGGSTQLSWLSSTEKGEVQMPHSGAVSMPYGAAAMLRRLKEAEKDRTTDKLRLEIMQAVKDAYKNLNVPSRLEQEASVCGGFTLYLSGGGFRGWGYVLMSCRNRVQPYPIPVINGFKATRDDFMGTQDVEMAAAAALENETDEIFRVSDRRASQVPAVAFLINALAEALPQIKEVRFCQGGVREGYLFSSFDSELQRKHPLVVATQPFSRTESTAVVDLIKAAIPTRSILAAEQHTNCPFEYDLLRGFSDLAYYYSTHSKDLQASAALRSTTSGILAGVHGILHEDRALLALLLCARWGGEVPPTDEVFKRNLEQLTDSSWTIWWINYVGTIAALIASVFPAGVNDSQQQNRVQLKAQWSSGTRGKPTLHLEVELNGEIDPEMLAKEIKDIEKVGKKKNWVGGKEGIGYKVKVDTAVLSAQLP